MRGAWARRTAALGWAISGASGPLGGRGSGGLQNSSGARVRFRPTEPDPPGLPKRSAAFIHDCGSEAEVGIAARGAKQDGGGPFSLAGSDTGERFVFAVSDITPEENRASAESMMPVVPDFLHAGAQKVGRRLPVEPQPRDDNRKADVRMDGVEFGVRLHPDDAGQPPGRTLGSGNGTRRLCRRERCRERQVHRLVRARAKLHSPLLSTRPWLRQSYRPRHSFSLPPPANGACGLL